MRSASTARRPPSPPPELSSAEMPGAGQQVVDTYPPAPVAPASQYWTPDRKQASCATGDSRMSADLTGQGAFCSPHGSSDTGLTQNGVGGSEIWALLSLLLASRTTLHTCPQTWAPKTAPRPCSSNAAPINRT